MFDDGSINLIVAVLSGGIYAMALCYLMRNQFALFGLPLLLIQALWSLTLYLHGDFWFWNGSRGWMPLSVEAFAAIEALLRVSSLRLTRWPMRAAAVLLGISLAWLSVAFTGIPARGTMIHLGCLGMLLMTIITATPAALRLTHHAMILFLWCAANAGANSPHLSWFAADGAKLCVHAVCGVCWLYWAKQNVTVPQELSSTHAARSYRQ